MIRSRRLILRMCTGLAVTAIAGCSSLPDINKPVADRVYTNGTIYTVDSQRTLAEAIAIKDGEIVAVGDSESVSQWIGASTQVEDLDGKMVLPGFHDAHIHPMQAAAESSCDMNNLSMSPIQAAEFVQACIARNQTEEGGWVVVSQFNPAVLSKSMAPYKTIREVLDFASDQHPVYLLGSDGHAYAANSLALQKARTKEMKEYVPVTKASLQGFWKQAGFAEYFGVDAQGNPDGVVKDIAAYDAIDYQKEDVEAFKKNPDPLNNLT